MSSSKVLSRLARGCVHALAGLALTGLLVACGGGGGDKAGTPIFDGGSGTGTPGSAATASALDLVLSASSLPNDGSQTSVATVTALDSKRNALANVPVSVSVNNGGIATPSATTTDKSGLISAAIGIGSDPTIRTITVTATSGSLSKSAVIEVRDATLGGTTGPTIDVSVLPNKVTPATPASAVVTVRGTNGQPLPNVVVGLTSARGNLVALSSSSVQTGANGIAPSVSMTAGVDGLTGADELVAVATIGGVQVTGRRSFSVEGATPTLSLDPIALPIKPSTGKAQVTATVLDAKGVPVSGQLVTFSAKNSKVLFDAATALTGSTGKAVTSIFAADGAMSSADLIQAATTLGSKNLTSETGVQIVGESPSLNLTLTNSNVTWGTKQYANVVVRNVSGVVQANALVTFTSQLGLLSFEPASAKTDASGAASVAISPLTASTNGADIIQAKVTVGGTTVSQQASVQLSGATAGGTPVLQLNLTDKGGAATSSISVGSPATVSARFSDAAGLAVSGQVVTFSVKRGLAKTNVATALTDSKGEATAFLSPITAGSAGADEVNASVNYGGTAIQASKGFQIQATNIALTEFSSVISPLSAYGQTPLNIKLTGVDIGSPVNMTVTSACVGLGKATLSPSTISTTNSAVQLQFRDNGCGAIQPADQLLVVVDGTSISKALTLAIDPPAVASLAFVQALPEAIYLKGSGFVENSVVTFEVRDAAGNPLPGKVVELRLQTGAGGVTMEGRGVESTDPPSAAPFVQTSNAQGRVSVRINSGTQPSPVRIQAKLQGTTISTVSSNLSVAIGLPSQLNFSISQGTANIEGGDIDGTSNTYQIIASDRNGNPVPVGTSINFVTEGGQIQAIKQTTTDSNGIARAVSNFVSSNPRPADGRVTVTAYALGEESFLDLNGNNAYDFGEPFQDLGRVFKDRYFDGSYDASIDEYVPLAINDGSACAASGSVLLGLDPSIPSVPGTCDGKWSGAGQVYVRRAIETVFSKSTARPLWPFGSTQATNSVSLQTTGDPAVRQTYREVQGGNVDSCSDSAFTFLAADSNSTRLNPMAAGTVITVSSPSKGLTVAMLGGNIVPNTSTVSSAGVSFSYDPLQFPKGSVGLVAITFTSPSKTSTTATMTVTRPLSCP